MRKLLIAEQSEELVKGLEYKLKDQWNLSICMDGYSTLDTLKYVEPDAMVIDLNLPQKDGLSVLEESFPALPPVVLVLTNYISDYIEQTVSDLGVGYIMRKPYSVDQITHRLTDMYNAQYTPVTKTERHLKGMRLNSTYSGYKCLLAAIPLFKEDPSQLLQKELYSKVAELCRLNDARCVERVIRFAIYDAWERKDVRIWSRYFPQNEFGGIDLPTNKEFIKSLSEKI